MQMITKSGAVTFTHDDEFKGEVAIQRGDRTVSVPASALRKFAGEMVRAELLERLVKAKPEDLLSRGAA